MKINICILLLLSFIITQGVCQTSALEWFVTGNTNLYYPISESSQGVYPILWYDKETDPKLLIGGFGFGVTTFYPLKEKVSIKGQANLSRHVYWDKAYTLSDSEGKQLNFFFSGSADYTLGFTGTAQYHLSKALLIGSGLGIHSMLISMTRIPAEWEVGKEIIMNRNYKRVLPVFPIEFSIKLDKLLFSCRYEYSIMNKLKSDLSRYQMQKYHLLSFDVGFKLP